MRQGYDAVVVYDDLSRHAVAFRHMALLLRRTPGRDAFPSDVFFVHARLLERAAQLSTGGSLTALPIVQTLGGDLSGYISTNIISITDGQIFLVQNLINKGIRPAVDLTLSVSRVGSAAQYSAMTYVSKRAKVIYSMYKTYAGSASVGGLSGDIKVYVNRGERLIAFMTQSKFETYSLYKQLVGLFALSLPAMDVIMPSNVHLFFMLLWLRHFDYVLGLNDHLLAYYCNARSIEPMLMVFGFELVEEDITEIITQFSKFFAYEIQNNTPSDVLLLLAELCKRDELLDNMQ